MSQSTKPFRVLSIDGGGIRGLFCARLLQHLEERTGKPIWELFDLVVGTSVGGFCAAVLTHPKKPGVAYSAEELATFLSEQSYVTRIFRPFHGRELGWLRRFLTWLAKHAVRILHILVGRDRHPGKGKQAWRRPWYDGLFHPLYSGASFRSLMQEIFGDARLADSLTNTATVAWNVFDQEMVVFHSRPPTGRPEAGEVTDATTADAVVSTAAPPVMLPMALVRSQSAGEMCTIDGGITATNPVFEAFAAAHGLKQSEETPVLLVSLGTGERVIPNIRRGAAFFPNWGAAEWLTHDIVTLMFHAPTSGTARIAHRLFEAKEGSKPLVEGVDYHRYQVPLDVEEAGIHVDIEADNISPQNIAQLEKLARWAIEDRFRDDLDRLVETLRAG